MRKYWFLGFLQLFVVVSQAQSFQTTQYGATLKDAEELDRVCPPPLDEGDLGFNANRITQKSAKKIVNKILFDLGIENQYKLRECKEMSKGNAKAVMLRRGNKFEQFILYDVDFLNEMANKISNPDDQAPAAATFILAHEVGHHIKNHTLNYTEEGSNPEIEIEADEYAAFTMAKIGYSLDDVLQTPRTEKNLITKFFSTHPGRIDRMKAAFKGWMKYAENDSVLKSANASNIYNYHKEIEGYELFIKEQRQKVQTNNSTSEDEKVVEIKKPQISTKELKEKKQQDEAGEVLQKYFKALGGMANVNSIKTMSFQELTSFEGFDYEYHYDQKSPTLLIVTNFTEGNLSGEQYKISNDSVYYRYEKGMPWKYGLPPGGVDNPQTFKNQIASSTGNFLEEFKLFSSPDLVALKETITFEGEQCHRLEVKEILGDVDIDKRGTGSKALIRQNRYYRVSDGLLHATEEIKKIQYLKKNKPDGRATGRTVTILRDYDEIVGLKFPKIYEISSTISEGGQIYEDPKVTKTVSNIEVIFKETGK